MLVLATRLIDENGRTITLSKTSLTAADPAKPWEGPAAATTTTTAKAVFLDPITSRDWGFVDEQDAFLEHRADQIALVAGTVDIEDNDTIVDGTIVWKINKTVTLKPGDTALIHQLYVNK